MRSLFYVWMIALAALLQFASAARSEEPAPNPRSAPLSELHATKLQNLNLQQMLINQARLQLIAEICAAAKMERCVPSPDLQFVTEVITPKPKPHTQPASLKNESGADPSSQPKEKPKEK